MRAERRQEIFRWSRDLVVAVVVVPGMLSYFGVTPFWMVVAGVAALMALKLWERWPVLARHHRLTHHENPTPPDPLKEHELAMQRARVEAIEAETELLRRRTELMRQEADQALLDRVREQAWPRRRR